MTTDTAIILAHGAGQGMNSPFMKYFRDELTRRGFPTTTFNFEYMEAKRKMPDPQPKLRARYRQVVAEVLQSQNPRRLFVGGKSMGGRVASYIAGDTPGVTGLIFLGYPLHPPGNQSQLRDEHLYSLQLPMLFVSGTKDVFAERELLDRVVRKIGARATLVWIENGDHSLTRSWPIAAEAIAAWLPTI